MKRTFTNKPKIGSIVRITNNNHPHYNKLSKVYVIAENGWSYAKLLGNEQQEIAYEISYQDKYWELILE